MSEKKPSSLGKAVAMGILCALCGFGGGVVANLTGIGRASQTTAKLSDLLPDENPILDTNPFQEEEDDDRPFVSGAALGITVQEVITTDETEGGVYVMSVADESNAKDIVLAGDRIVKIDHLEVTGVSALSEYILEKEPGDIVTLTLKRDGETLTVEVTLISRNSVTNENNRKS